MAFDPGRYPAAQRLDLVEDLFGHQVADPYRWLEDSGSAHTREWLDAEESLWTAYRAGLPRREEFAGRVRELLRIGNVGTPAWRGSRQFSTRRDPDQDHAALYVTDMSDLFDAGAGVGVKAGAGAGDERVLVDPAALDPSGRTTLDQWQPDKEGRLLAYQLSAGGTEESLLRVLDAETGTVIDGPIDRCRYSGVAWLPGGKAFYYVRRLAADQVPEGESQYHRRVYLHTVGTDPETDTLIFGEGRDKTSYYRASVSRDGRWLFISASIGTAPRNDLWIADLTSSDPARPSLTPVSVGLDAYTSIWPGRDGRLYVYTDLGAPRGRIAIADAEHPGPEGWRDLIPEDPEAVLRDYTVLDDLARPVLLVSLTRHAISEITAHDLATGGTLGTLELPGIGTVGGLAERPEGGHEAWFGYTDYTTPPRILRYDARTQSVDTWATPPGTPANPPNVTARQVTYHSKDGTPVRMVIVEPAADATGVKKDAGVKKGRPGILYGYGGFDISLTPGYSASTLAWVEAGGVYAAAGLRGGRVPGPVRAIQARRVMEHRVRHGRPDELDWLLSYSPYHHVTDGTPYPAVLFTVFSNDTRVDPLHAYKMCAALQHASTSGLPVLLRAEAQVGHGARAVSLTAGLTGDSLAFAARETGLTR